MTVRKKRNDRNYIIYRVTIGDEIYVGLTVAVGRGYWKSVKIRVQKHISRALNEDKDWTMCNCIRDSDETIYYEILEVIRGRKNAYQRERELIRELEPSLNDF
jgi:hypothetical protein|tara:strand:- start:726 stop:1034 length:309 start_codon:yes stop_codon:yes gene_type:complete